MPILTKFEITDLIKRKKLIFSPGLDAFQLQPHAVDLRLGYTFHIPKTWKVTSEGRKAIQVDPLDGNGHSDNFEQVTLKKGQYFEVLPREFVIVSTLEKITINDDNLMAVLYPRSSVNRRGLAVDLTGIVDVWYSGQLMIPLLNNTETQTIRVYPGERICQITFDQLASSIDKESAFQHGLTKAKYLSSTDTSLNYQIDKKSEIDLIKKGDIVKLKEKYKIKY